MDENLYCVKCYQQVTPSKNLKNNMYHCKKCDAKFNIEQAKSFVGELHYLESGGCPKCKTELDFSIEHRILKNGCEIECPECNKVFKIGQAINFNKDTLRQSLYAFVWSFPVPILGLIFGIKAVKDIKNTGGEGMMLAILAITLPILRAIIGYPPLRQPISDISTLYDLRIFDITILIIFGFGFLYVCKSSKIDKFLISIAVIIIIIFNFFSLQSEIKEAESLILREEFIQEYIKQEYGTNQ